MHTTALLLSLALSSTPSLQDDEAQPGRGWGPEQATGAPDCPDARDDRNAWASRTTDGAVEWLRVGFPEPFAPTAVRVFESYSPGALVAVIGIDAAGERHELWRGLDPTPASAARGVSLVPLNATMEVSALELALDSPAVPNWNEVDAVGAHDAEGRLWWASTASASSTYARADAPAAVAPRELPPVSAHALEPEWLTPAEGLFEVWLEARSRPEPDADLVARLAEQIVLVQRALHSPPPAARGFEGLWDATYGPLRLTIDGDRVTGLYPGGTIEGTLEEERLTFSYSEATGVNGTGWFELTPDATRFEGKWREDGARRDQDWKGTRRAPPRSGRKWLVVLEAPWEESLGATEFSFGGMLRAIFDHQPNIEVRQRYFADQASFETWCQELTFFEEPVYLFVATHASRRGLQSAGGLIPPEAVAAALRDAHSLRLVHFSACDTMRGKMPEVVNAACRHHPEFAGVSGYDISVDWMGSALTEFTYLDLLLNRGLAPADAAAALTVALDFADDSVSEGSPVPASHFRFVPSERGTPDE